MSLGRISTYSVHHNTLNDINRTQFGLINLQKQLSSGFKADNFEGLNGQVEQFTNLEAKVKKLKTYQTNNNLVITRIQTTNTSLDQLIQTGSDIKNLLVQWRNPAMRTTLPLTQQLAAFKQAISSQLNASVEGRYLFGGSRTNVPPVIDPIPQPVSVGTPDHSYYQGSEEDVVLRAQDNFEMQYNIRADDDAFQKLFAGIFQAEKAGGLDSDDEMQTAITFIDDAVQSTIALQAENNQNYVILNQINDRHETLQLYYQGVTEQVSKTDVLAVSTQVAVDQVILQSTFQAFSRINGLRLVDFL